MILPLGWTYWLPIVALTYGGFAPFYEPNQPPRPVQVMAHRGIWTAAPENTRRSITMAAADSFEWVQLDVRQTRDHQHILFHDAMLDAKSTGKGPISAMTLAELDSLDFGSWFAPRFAGEKVCTLRQALELARGKINLCLDAKEVDPSQLVRDIVECGMTSQVVVYGDERLLEEMIRLAGDRILLMARWNPLKGTPNAFVSQHRWAAVEIHPPDVSPETCRLFHALGVKVEASALGSEHDQPEFWLRAQKAGVDWIQTDYPLAVAMTLARDRAGDRWPVGIALHRGAGRYAPENSLPAIQWGVMAAADYIEIDIRSSADGEYFLMHDRTLDRTTNRSGAIDTILGKDVRQAQVGSRFGLPFADARVPALAQTPALLGSRAHFYLDAKSIPAEALARFIRENRLEQRSVVYQSADYLKALKSILPEARAMPPLDQVEDLALLGDLSPFAVDAAWHALSPAFIAKCHERQIKVFSDALGLHETIRDYRRAILAGVDVIQTDQPARLLRAIELHLAESTDRRLNESP